MNTEKSLEHLLNLYSKSKEPISVDFRKLVPQLSSPNRATHLIHPYPAKLLMHIPYFFLSNDILSKKNDFIIDPFSGSGTVLLEALIANRQAIGADVSPLARLISSVKTQRYDVNRLKAQLAVVLKRIKSVPEKPFPNFENIDFWFYPHIIKQLQCILESIRTIQNESIRNFFLVCFSSTVRRVSLADPRIAVPVKLNPDRYPENHRLKLEADRKISKLKHANVSKIFRVIAEANIKRFIELEGFNVKGTAEILTGDSKKLFSNSPGLRGAAGKILSNRIQFAITSPPYAGAQKYIRSMSLSLGWLGICEPEELLEAKATSIGREDFKRAEYEKPKKVGIRDADLFLKKVRDINPLRAHIASTYLTEMTASIKETHRVLNKSGYFLLVSGNNKVCGRDFETTKYLAHLAKKTGFKLKLSLIDDIRSRGLMTKRNKTASMINSESVMLFQKE